MGRELESLRGARSGPPFSKAAPVLLMLSSAGTVNLYAVELTFISRLPSSGDHCVWGMYVSTAARCAQLELLTNPIKNCFNSEYGVIA